MSLKYGNVINIIQNHLKQRCCEMCKSKVRLDGKTALVTGGGSGMGYETAKDLAYRGARVIIASRNATKLETVRDEIRKSTNNPNVDYKVLDLESFRSIRSFSQEMRQEQRLDMLVNNAGGYGLPDVHTEDGLSLMMQVNFFGPFLLTYLLLPLVKSSAPSRIINSSAMSLYFGSIDFDHWNDLGRYSLPVASGNAKLATFIATAEWDRRLKGTGVNVNSFDPFFVRDTDITKNQSEEIKNFSNVFLSIFGLPREDVGQQMAYYASDPEVKHVSGQHYAFCYIAPRHWILNDMDLRRRLWREAKKIVKITKEEEWDNKPDCF